MTFDGVVRDNTKGRRVVSLQYEAYEPMAVKEMRRIGAEIREQWFDVERVGIIHRFGPLKISESSVVIVVTSPHRRVAFEACRYAIDRLKQTVPIWKKEIFEDGEEWVEGQARSKSADPEKNCELHFPFPIGFVVCHCLSRSLPATNGAFHLFSNFPKESLWRSSNSCQFR